jgi:antitoxin HicB
MNQYLGSNFDDFLAEEGILAETQAVAWKRITVFQATYLQSAKASTDRAPTAHRSTPLHPKMPAD